MFPQGHSRHFCYLIYLNCSVTSELQWICQQEIPLQYNLVQHCGGIFIPLDDQKFIQMAHQILGKFIKRPLKSHKIHKTAAAGWFNRCSSAAGGSSTTKFHSIVWDLSCVNAKVAIAAMNSITTPDFLLKKGRFKSPITFIWENSTIITIRQAQE